MASYPASAPYGRTTEEKGTSAWLAIVAVMLGLAVAVLAIAAVVSMQAADEARDDANAAAGQSTGAAAPAAATHDPATDHNAALPLESFAGKVAENADALAKAHAAYDAR